MRVLACLGAQLFCLCWPHPENRGSISWWILPKACFAGTFAAQVHRAGTQCARSRLPSSASHQTPHQTHNGSLTRLGSGYLYKLCGEKSLQRKGKKKKKKNSQSPSPQLYLYTANSPSDVRACLMRLWRTMRIPIVHPSLAHFHCVNGLESGLSVTRKASSSLNQEN